MYFKQCEKVGATNPGPEIQNANIIVIDLAGRTPIPLGQFEVVWQLAPTPNESYLVFN